MFAWLRRFLDLKKTVRAAHSLSLMAKRYLLAASGSGDTGLGRRSGWACRIMYKQILLIAFFLCAGCGVKNINNPINSTSFYNGNEQVIYVRDVFCDGKNFMMPVGYLVPNGKSTASMFPNPFPRSIQINYKIDNESHTQSIDLSEQIAFFKKNRSKEVTLYIIYTAEGNFISKIHIDTGGDSLRLEGYMHPDENDLSYQSYKNVLKATLSNDVKSLKELKSSGAPFIWKNEPVSNSTIEWACLRGNSEIVDIIEQTGTIFPSYTYANCIKLAAQDDNAEILRKLLVPKYTSGITNRSLQSILYATVSLNTKSSPGTLDILLKHFELSPNYRVRDYGHTLLIVAAQSGKKDMVEYLLNIGADKELSIQSGEKAIDLALDPEINELLLK